MANAFSGSNTNVAVGQGAMQYCSGSSINVAIGVNAMQNTTEANTNVAIGQSTMRNSNTVQRIMWQSVVQCLMFVTVIIMLVLVPMHLLIIKTVQPILQSVAMRAEISMPAKAMIFILAMQVWLVNQMRFALGNGGTETALYSRCFWCNHQFGGSPVLVDSNGQLGTIHHLAIIKKIYNH